MKVIISPTAEKGLRKIQKKIGKSNGEKLKKDLQLFVSYFMKEEPLPDRFKAHKVRSFWEAHLLGYGSDFLVLYRKSADILSIIAITDHDGMNRINAIFETIARLQDDDQTKLYCALRNLKFTPEDYLVTAELLD